MARYIQPMAANARDLVSHKNYRDVSGKKEVLEDLLKQAKKGTLCSSKAPTLGPL